MRFWHCWKAPNKYDFIEVILQFLDFLWEILSFVLLLTLEINKKTQNPVFSEN
jgi:hypothetical protein